MQLKPQSTPCSTEPPDTYSSYDFASGAHSDAALTHRMLVALYEGMHEPVIIADPERHVISINPAASKLFGYTVDEIAGKSNAILFADPAQFHDIGRKYIYIDEDTVFGDEVITYKCKDGSRFKGRLNIKKIRAGDGRVVTILGFISDISAVFEAEADRQRNSALLEAALDSIPEGFVIFDQDDRFVDCNQAFRSMFGGNADWLSPKYTFEEILRFGLMDGRYPEAGTTPEEHETWVSERMRHHRNPKGPVIHQIGEDRWLKIDERKTPRGFTVGIRTDVTESVLAQRQMVATNTYLEARTAALEEFALVVSHDLQAPLRHLAIFVDMLLDVEGLTDKAAHYAEQIGDSATRMQHLVSGLLDYCNLAYRKVDKTEIGLKALVEATADLLETEIAEANMTITVRRDGMLFCDPVLMTRVFQNLFVNAIRHAAINPLEITVDMHRQDDCWEISVTDNGVGIPSVYSQRIFQMFKRFGGHSQSAGMGVGLTLAKQVIESHGGRIWLDNTNTDGACFRFTLPYN